MLLARRTALFAKVNRVPLLSQQYRVATMTTISNAIMKDHRELEDYYKEVINNPDNHDHQERYGNQFVWELARHSVGEELVVYPAMEKYLGQRGKEIAEHDREEHHKVFLTFFYETGKQPKISVNIWQVKEMLKTFQGLSPKDGNYMPKLKQLWKDLDMHIQEEEKRDLPALEEKLIEEKGESESMAKSFSRTKMFVPSRSHPSAGEHPPFETAMGLLAAPLDHVADIFRKFPDDTVSPNPTTQ